MKNKTLAVVLGISMLCASIQPTAFSSYASEQKATDGQPPQMPDGQQPPNMENGQPPQMPDGQQPTNMENSQPPQMPDGQQPPNMENGQPPQMPDGQQPPNMGEGQPPEKPDGQQPGGMGTPGGMGGETPVEGQLGSWNMGSEEDYDYDAAIFLQDGAIVDQKSSPDRMKDGEYDDTHASGIILEDTESHHEVFVIQNSDYVISGSDLSLMTEADGSDTCDFSGVGSAVAVFGDSDVTIEDSRIETAGVATMPVFADAGATVTVRNSTLISNGGTLHSEYLNTPSQGQMVAPPWILGIMGNARCTNLMGNNTTMNVIDSDTSAGAWAVLSVDAGNQMALNIVNTSLTLTNADESAAEPLQADGGQIYETLDNPYTVNYGSGYGTYAIGKAQELFAGADLKVGTYATIFTGGDARYTALSEGEYITLPQADGGTMEYTVNESKVTEIHSDTFGFMAHQDANTLSLEKGTVVDSGFDTFLIKTGSSNETMTAVIDDTKITNGGVLIQVMDNDDATNGGMMEADDEANTNGGSQNFKPVHEENAGFQRTAAESTQEVQKFTFTNGEYSGNIYNASGSDASVNGALKGSALSVTFGENAIYSGAAASTAAVHVTYDGAMKVKENGGAAFDSDEEADAFAAEYQNLSFDITHYFDLGHVANQIYDNGANAIDVTLTGNAVWYVTGTSLLRSLTIEGDAQVIVPENITLTVNGTEYTNCVVTGDGSI